MPNPPVSRDDMIAAGGRVIAQFMASKLRFLMIVLGLGMVGILFAHGFSFVSVTFALICFLMLGAAWIVFSFWIWFFRNLGGNRDRSPEQP